MSDGVQAWQICILVTAAIVLAEAAITVVARRWGGGIRLPAWWRTAALALLLVLTVVVFVIALGPSRADQLSSVAAAVAAVGALYLTYRSYHQTGSVNSARPPRPPEEPRSASNPADEDDLPGES